MYFIVRDSIVTSRIVQGSNSVSSSSSNRFIDPLHNLTVPGLNPGVGFCIEQNCRAV